MYYSKCIALATVLSLFLLSSHPRADTHEIILQVDTQNIGPTNTDDVCTFGQDASISNAEFTINVRKGDVIIWKGVSSSAPDTDEVLITSINHEGGARVFGRNVLRDSRQNPGVVLGVISDGKDGDEEKYKVSFKVLNSGEKRGGTFHIDPKIRIKN